MRWALALSLLGTMLVGCSPAVEVGTGDNKFKKIAEGSTVSIACGMQGESFIFGALRTQVLRTANADLTIEIVEKASGAIVCHEAIDSAQLESADDGFNQYTGIRCFVEDPAGLKGKTVTMTGTIRDTANDSGTASVTFKVDSPEGNCGG